MESEVEFQWKDLPFPQGPNGVFVKSERSMGRTSRHCEEIMESLEILTESVLNIFKEFSSGRRPLNAATLKEAFSARKEIQALLHPVLNASPAGRSEEVSESGKMQARIPLPEAATPKNATTAGQLSGLRDAFLKILKNLGPLIKGEHEIQLTRLLNKINQCDSFLQFGLIGELIGTLVGKIIDDTVGRMDYSNDFLVELSKDLYKLEDQLLSFQAYNRDTHQLSSKFNDDLLTNAHDMHSIFDTGKSLQDIKTHFTSKLVAISNAIQVKNHSDEVRAKEADTKIAQLQNSLNTYNLEILQIRDRADSLEKEVLLDALTEINNRRAFDLQIRENLRRFHRNGEQFSLVLIDIDHFKKVNDEYGHKAGDKCLQEIAKVIRTSLRKTDFFGRYGGEELIAILNGSNIENAREVADKLRLRIVRMRFTYQDKVIPITISLGVTQVLQTDADPETPFIRADNAVYRAKSLGRNRVCAI